VQSVLQGKLREGVSKHTVKYFDLELILERVVLQTSGA
jgi:hypothetical protein